MAKNKDIDVDPKMRLKQMNNLEAMIEAEQIRLSKVKNTATVMTDDRRSVKVTINGLQKVTAVHIDSTLTPMEAAPMVMEAMNDAMDKVRKKSSKAFGKVVSQVKQIEPTNLTK